MTGRWNAFGDCRKMELCYCPKNQNVLVPTELRSERTAKHSPLRRWISQCGASEHFITCTRVTITLVRITHTARSLRPEQGLSSRSRPPYTALFCTSSLRSAWCSRTVLLPCSLLQQDKCAHGLCSPPSLRFCAEKAPWNPPL